MPHQEKTFWMVASARVRAKGSGLTLRTYMAPWPKECEETDIQSTDFSALGGRAKQLAQRALPVIRKQQEMRASGDTLIGIDVSLHLARNQRAPRGFLEFRGFTFSIEELEPVQAVA